MKRETIEINSLAFKIVFFDQAKLAREAEEAAQKAKEAQNSTTKKPKNVKTVEGKTKANTKQKPKSATVTSSEILQPTPETLAKKRGPKKKKQADTKVSIKNVYSFMKKHTYV